MSLQSKVNKALGISGVPTKHVYEADKAREARIDATRPFTGTFAETKAEKDLRISQAVVDKAQAAMHDADPHNASDIKIKRKKMEDAEKHHHTVWIAHDKEVKATEAKLAKTHKEKP